MITRLASDYTRLDPTKEYLPLPGNPSLESLDAAKYWSKASHDENSTLFGDAANTRLGPPLSLVLLVDSGTSETLRAPDEPSFAESALLAAGVGNQMSSWESWDLSDSPLSLSFNAAAPVSGRLWAARTRRSIQPRTVPAPPFEVLGLAAH
ncbi:uncharacterized protein PITG_09924 [Phytophthora infestans T30-4]|uniref:Uncharacterized protein n=1 Tax=Phytophthora infestans (strain T30-4) TaxID=403677 RepID=D0NDV3_PHYIT|nr:uncharacterized protein PITG_09924 [Phytophthora infestans T30-4]EEY56398.1 hypothetical protein PITG_09924 [Phytophthora infestans T30-4]|eukprot:XP_002902472.1 hypothetical protein PITG_09924 [Phytophthora infestans T30-4]